MQNHSQTMPYILYKPNNMKNRYHIGVRLQGYMYKPFLSTRSMYVNKGMLTF